MSLGTNIVKNNDVYVQIMLLKQLKDGWLDGEGVALNTDKLAIIADHFSSYYPEEMTLPIVVPTPEGNVLFEWSAEGSPSLDINLDNFESRVHIVGSDGVDIVRDFKLVNIDEWKLLFVFLKDNIKPYL